MTGRTLRPDSPTGSFDRLGAAARMLLTTDGTVTPMLEQMVVEPIITSQLSHDTRVSPTDIAAMPQSYRHDRLTARTTQLVGAHSGTVYVHARSVLVLDALPEPLRTDLMTTREPIGRLLRKHRIESFRELLTCSVPDDCPSRGGASRRYRVFVGGIAALLIEEFFSSACFTRHA
ncbi:chorismate pyruvate-lyase family protein [Streptomyces sp. ICN988]|uniref:chorismate--pyruvate lyase family protein n=1 Tax=Streptomyces sp. ICN988 TaxID=2983765 RepID=UPI0021E4D14A|nr:chorismate pyruvate-lyase family protein [Streptomyces sp. ICN988]MCV2458409.1 chorismate pyruvate-lyase family protein [Streptomyces sp. ICN988]